MATSSEEYPRIPPMAQTYATLAAYTLFYEAIKTVVSEHDSSKSRADRTYADSVSYAASRAVSGLSAACMELNRQLESIQGNDSDSEDE